MVRCAKLPASRILHKRINEKVYVDQRLPEGIWIAATEFIVNTPKLHVDRHRGVIRQSRSPGEDGYPKAASGAIALGSAPSGLTAIPCLPSSSRSGVRDDRHRRSWGLLGRVDGWGLSVTRRCHGVVWSRHPERTPGGIGRPRERYRAR